VVVLKYRWLHISDLHSICTGIKTKIMREALLDEIRYLNQQCKFTFLLITGDISDKNQGYDGAKELIHRIINAMGLNLEKVFIVPGNHDVNRNMPNNRRDLIRKGWSLDVLDQDEDDLIKELLSGQEDFFKAYESILGRKYPTDKVHFYTDIDENMSIIQLNTSWMCYDSENESGKLHIGLDNVYKCFNDDRLRVKPIKLAIGHHRISDFNKTVGNNLKSMFKSMDIDLYLGGHCHESTVVYDPIINTEFCSCRQARVENKDYPAGFIIGDINTEADQSSFQFYNWDFTLAKWMFDYTVSPAKHGKYYLRGSKFTREPESKRNVIVDLKLFGIPLNYQHVMDKFNIQKVAIYKSSISDIRPQSIEEWVSCLKDLVNLYDKIIKGSNKVINIFPIASIPLLVSFGYLMQNNNSNVRIYQYCENESEWVYDNHDDNILVNVSTKENGYKKLALALNISGDIKQDDITAVLGKRYDLLEVSIENTSPSVLNYKADVLRVKLAVKKKLDRISRNYDEIHLFLASPAGLCIEIGRIIRENMYPNTFVYNYVNSKEKKYSRIFNLHEIRNLSDFD